jgi:hypothetical protein
VKIVISKIAGVWYADVLEENQDQYRLTQNVNRDELQEEINNLGLSQLPVVYGHVEGVDC